MKFKAYEAVLVMNDTQRKVYVFLLHKGHTNKKPKIATVLWIKKWKVVKSNAER